MILAVPCLPCTELFGVSGGEAVLVREAHTAQRAPKSRVTFCPHCLTLYTLGNQLNLLRLNILIYQMVNTEVLIITGFEN